MIAVVTGASGFIGRNLVARLVAQGHTVRCLTRMEGKSPHSGATTWIVRYDDARALATCPAFDGADVVFHLASATAAPGERAYHEANVGSARNVVAAMERQARPPRLLYMSSLAAAGPASAPDAPMVEDLEPNPVEAYGRSKRGAERVVEAAGDRVPFTIVRPCSVFGPWDRDFLALFRFATSGVIVYPGVERHWMSLLHVDDVVTGAIEAATSAATLGRTYFLSSKRPIQWRELGEFIAAAVGRRVRHVNLPHVFVRGAAVVSDLVGQVTGSAGLVNRSKAELARQPAWVASGARAAADFGFRPAESLPEAVQATYLWYVRQGWLPPRRAGGPDGGP